MVVQRCHRRWAGARRLLGVILLLGLMGCADRGKTTVVMTFLPAVETSAPGQHYELFAVVNGTAVSIQKMEIQVDPATAMSLSPTRNVLDHYDPNTVLGLVDIGNDVIRAGGIRFETPVNLTGATVLFLTIEDNGDTDPAPTQRVAMRCDLQAQTRGTLGCILATPDNKEAAIGTASLVLPDDGVNPF